MHDIGDFWCCLIKKWHNENLMKKMKKNGYLFVQLTNIKPTHSLAGVKKKIISNGCKFQFTVEDMEAVAQDSLPLPQLYAKFEANLIKQHQNNGSH